MQLSDFDFELPNNLIAQSPSIKRTQSRLLIAGKQIKDKIFHQIIDYLQPNDLLILNNTKVLAARIFAKKISGGKLEIMLDKITGDTSAFAMIKSSRSPKVGSTIVFDDGNVATILSKKDALYNLKFSTNIFITINKLGHIPLPPYIKRSDDKTDVERYQSVFAKELGAVAAPTASLHFDNELLKNIKQKGIDMAFVTLHIGSGTFFPVKVENITQHKMHSEYFDIKQQTIDKINKCKKNGGRVIAVGTTAVRVLESTNGKKSSGETDIFIYPGYKFKVVDGMITNFHLPKSSLLMLVSAFSGSDKIKKIYQHAIDNKYRFFSYGDAMFLS